MYPVYHKIQTVFERDPATKHKTLLEGEYSRPEFRFLKNCVWTFTEKVDGTNIRVMFDGQGFEYYGKSDASQIPALLGNRLREMFEPLKEGFSKAFPKGCFFYGEGYGEKIQKVGGLYRKGQSFVLFDVDSNRVIGQDDIDGVFVSTIFMGVDALGFKKPFLFETMIFGWKRDYQEKYRTLKEARAGHKAAVELVKTGS